MAGKVTWLDLQLDKEGKSKGMAVCEYSHPIEAVQAISMLNNQRLYDRVLTVKMDSFEKEPGRREGELPVGLRSIGMGLGANGNPLADVASVISSMQQTPQSLLSQSQPFIGGSFSTATNSSSVITPFNNGIINNPFGVNLQAIQQSALQQQTQSQQSYERSGVYNQSSNTFLNSATQGPTPLLSTPSSYFKNSSVNSNSNYANGVNNSSGGISHQQQASITAGYGGATSGPYNSLGQQTKYETSKYEASYESPSRVFLIKNVGL